MSDRYIRSDGTLFVENRNFDRALNFQNKTRDMGLGFVFKTDNDILLSSKSFFAPYLTLGIGLINFDIKGDLLDSDGNRYDYASENVINNMIYETELPPLNTELENGYDLSTFYTNLGLGIRLRLGSGFEIFAQSDFIYTFTDYLDDVSGNYRANYETDFQAFAAHPGTNIINPENPVRGNPGNQNDWIIYHGIGLKFNFGASKKTFSAPRLSTVYPDYRTTGIRQNATREEIISEESQVSVQTGPVNSDLTKTERWIAQKQIEALEDMMRLLDWEQEIQKREIQILAGQIKEKTLSEIRQNVESKYLDLQKDTLLTPLKRDSLMVITDQKRFDLRYSLDSMDRRRTELKSEIDSINQLKKSNVNLAKETSLYILQDMETMRRGDTISVIHEERRELMEAKAGHPVRDRTLEERLIQLEAENRQLRRTQDSLRAISRERIYLETYQYPQEQERRRAQEPVQTERSEIRERIYVPREEVTRTETSPTRSIIFPGSVSRDVAPSAFGRDQSWSDVEKVALVLSSALLGAPIATMDQRETKQNWKKESILKSNQGNRIVSLPHLSTSPNTSGILYLWKRNLLFGCWNPKRKFFLTSTKTTLTGKKSIN